MYNTGKVLGATGLTKVAEGYQDMWEILHKSGDIDRAYLDNIKVEDATKDSVELEGENYDLYIFDKTIWKIDKDTKEYYIGPFNIDYSIIGGDTSVPGDYSGPNIYNEPSGNGEPTPGGAYNQSSGWGYWFGTYFNYIKDVKVYNQDKKDITTLGGSFEIVDENKKVIYDGSDKSNLQKLKPGMEFYIKIKRGNMELKDFTKFYAKFDFKYLYDISGANNLTRYEGTAYEWYYSPKSVGGKDVTLHGAYETSTTYPVYAKDEQGNVEKDENGKDKVDHYATSTRWNTYNKTVHLYTGFDYHLQKSANSSIQIQTHTHIEGKRVWDEKSVVITTEWEPKDIEIEIDKTCSETGDPLYGAEFDITLDIQGTDMFENTINKQVTITRKSDSDGKIRLTREEIESAAGVGLETFQGSINVTAVEKHAPAGHTITQGTYTGTVSSGGKLTINAVNNPTEGPIKLAKIDKNGNYIDADFEIEVFIADSDYPSNKLYGSTHNGYLYISEADLADMGINIDGFTGSLVLQINEVKTKNGYTIRGQGKSVTLTFENGALVEYNETDGELTVEYLFEDILTDFLNGDKSLDELPDYMRNYISEWINRQAENGMDYTDIMAWLKEYVEKNKDEIFKVMTQPTSEMSGGVIQITIENDEGMELPDIPPDTVKKKDLTMRIAGNVFVDGTETKGKANETDGKITQGEQMLGGIKVTLYEQGGKLAELVPNPEDPDEVRTNPTMTNDNGHYEFRGVDPLKDYYVEFEYNGVQYEATASVSAQYNSEEWAVTSKASESDTSARSKYNTVTPTTKVYHYDQLEGIYNAIQAYTLNYIMKNKSYPSDGEIKSAVKGYLNNNDQYDIYDIDERLDYVLSDSIVKAKAGYGGDGGSGTYPYQTLKEFLINSDLANMDDETYEFMKEEVKRLGAGQLQVHLGLKERDSTDLSLVKDIVESEFTINGHTTKYKYENGDSNYTEYIYREDYEYDDAQKQNTNKAYYDDITKEQEPELYITYKITVTNEMSISTNVIEIVDYFDPNFEVVEASVPYSTSGYEPKGTGNDGYSRIFLHPGTSLSGNSADITLKLKLKDAKNNLSKYLKTEDGKTVSKAWEVENFAEINAYSTSGSYIDIDSHPGNFSISNYKKALNDYQQAFSDFMNSMSESSGLAAQAARDRLLEVREDDAWEVSLTLINNGFKRELDGSVWEAISDDIKTASNLQDTNTLLQYIQDHGIGGITVELVELRDFGSDTGNGSDTGDAKVRARTSTDSNGNYHFESYIPGNYVIRFTYGDKDNPIRSEFTKDSEGKELQINGQFYQSTKANPNTDAQEYWYAQDIGTRYSDAQDGAQSRAKQIDAEIKGSTDSKSNNYNYTGAVAIDSGVHQDAINAYTSSIHAEGEYTKQVIDKAFSKNNADYNYEIENVDFGITPRAGVDLQIDKYVSNIKVYLQDRTLQLDCSFDYEEDEDGNKIIKNVTYNTTPETENLVNLVIANYGSTSFLDGLIEVLMDDQLYNGAQLEVTYTISVDNKSEYDTLRWIINNGTKVGVVYYQNEDYTKLPNYEQGKVIYQSDADQKFIKTTGTITPDQERIVKTSAVNIVDYVEPNLQFRKTNFLGEAINQDWTDTNKQEFISSRKDYEITSDSEAVKSEYDKLTSVYNQYIKAATGSKLLDELEPRNTDGKPMDSYRDTTLTLVTTLGTTASDTTDYEYHNLAEIAQMANTSGRVKKVEYYDVDGKLTSSDTYTEENRKKDDDKIPYLPTIGTSKSETVVFHAPTGLPISERVQTNVIIALVALVTLAGGIVLIKKYVLKTKQE